MPSIDRDRNIVRHILKYCDEVNTAHEDFDCSREKFMSSSTYRNTFDAHESTRMNRMPLNSEFARVCITSRKIW